MSDIVDRLRAQWERRHYRRKGEEASTAQLWYDRGWADAMDQPCRCVNCVRGDNQ